MRFLYLADIRFPLERANGIQTMETCHALAARGHEVILGVRSDTRRPARDPFVFYDLPFFQQLKIRMVRVRGPSPVRRAGYLARALCWVLEFRDGDVIFTRDLGVAAMVLRLPRLLRPPVVYESHAFAPASAQALPELVSGGAPAAASKQRRLLRRERRVWLRAEGYVVVPRSLQAELVRQFGPREHAAVIPNGVRITMTRQFVPPKTPVIPLIVYAGHLYPWKGVDVVLRSLPLLPEVALKIVGGFPSERDLPRLQALARDLGVTERVTFTGLVDRARVPALLAAADILVLPNVPVSASAGHTSPLKLFEYLAVGKPIVASDLPAIREVLRDGQNAVLVEPGRPDALAAGIRRVLEDRTLAERIARGAFDEAPDYSWDRRAERIEQLFERVLGGQSQPTPQRSTSTR